MRAIYVAGAHPGAGSTAVAAGLALALRGAGVRAVAVKPAPHREDDADPAFLTALNGGEREADASVVVFDGLPLAGGNGASAALAERLDAAVVGVVPFADSAEHPGQWRSAFGERLTGVVVNRLSRYGGHSARTVLASALEEAGAPPLAVVPEDRLLLAPSVVQVGEHLGATFFCKPEETERLIEHFVIGGLITEWGGNYFGRLANQAVLVRGGRIDIQMSALQFPMACLILSATAQPQQYVYQRALAQDVPLLTVGSPTMAVAEALEQVHELVTIRHRAKAERMAALLAEAGVERITRAAAAP